MKRLPNNPQNCLLPILVFLFTTALTAQTPIAGFVHDIQRGEPLIGVTVAVKGTTFGAITAADGSFRFSTPESLPLTLVVSYLGYTTQELYLVGDTEYLDIYLEAEEYTTEEVVITASRWKEKIYDSPASLSVVPTARLEAQVVTNPLLVLQYTPGVQMVVQGTERVNVGLREGRNAFVTRTQVLLDNRSLSSPGLQYLDASNSALNNLDLDRVEVVRGAATAIYGPGATSGVIHFQSKDPFKYPGTDIEVVAGERATFRTAIRHAWHSADRRLGYKINANYRRSDDWVSDTPNPEYKDEIIDPRTNEVIYTTGGKLRKDNRGYSANATLEFRPAYDRSFSIGGGLSRFEGLSYTALGEVLAQNNEVYGIIKAKYGALFAQISLNHGFGFNNDHPTFNYRTGQISPIARTHWEGQLQYGLHIRPMHTRLVMGSDFTRFTANTQRITFGRYDGDNYGYAGVYAQSKTPLLDQFDLVLSGRADYFNLFDEVAFAHGVAVLYKMNETNTLRISYNQGPQQPSMFALFLDYPLNPDSQYDNWLMGGKDAQTFGEHPSTSWYWPQLAHLGTTPGVGIDLQTAYNLAIDYVNVWPEMIDYLKSIAPRIEGFSDAALQQPGLDGNDPVRLTKDRNFELGFTGRIFDKLKVLAEYYYTERTGGISQPVLISPLVVLHDLPDDLKAAVANAVDPNDQVDGRPLSDYNLTPAIIAQWFNDAVWKFANPTGFTGLIETEQAPEGGRPVRIWGFKSLNGKEVRTGVDIGVQYSIMETLMLHASYGRLLKTYYKPPEGGEPFDVFSIATLPKYKYKVGLYYWQLPATGFRASINVQHDSEWATNVADGPFRGSIPARTIWDASIGYKWFNRLSIDVTATNLLDKKYNYPGLPEIGRQVLARVVYSFGK